MRLRLFSFLLFSLVLFSGGAAFAEKRQIQEFQTEESDADAASKRKGPKYNINDYGRDVSVETKPIPWMYIGLVATVFVVAIPFGLRAYRDTSKEIADSQTFGVQRGRGQADE